MRGGEGGVAYHVLLGRVVCKNKGNVYSLDACINARMVPRFRAQDCSALMLVMPRWWLLLNNYLLKQAIIESYTILLSKS